MLKATDLLRNANMAEQFLLQPTQEGHLYNILLLWWRWLIHTKLKLGKIKNGENVHCMVLNAMVLDLIIKIEFKISFTNFITLEVVFPKNRKNYFDKLYLSTKFLLGKAYIY